MVDNAGEYLGLEKSMNDAYKMEMNDKILLLLDDNDKRTKRNIRESGSTYKHE